MYVSLLHVFSLWLCIKEINAAVFMICQQHHSLAMNNVIMRATNKAGDTHVATMANMQSSGVSVSWPWQRYLV